ncbi:MAG: chromate transporter, partial [Armatimonadetes bacterium]|nr:chromate transporter [Armatimonadota bacterium]
AVFYGLKPAVMAIVAAAALRLGAKTLRNAVLWSFAGLAFVGLYFFHAPFPLIIAAAALGGWAARRVWPDKMTLPSHGPTAPADHGRGAKPSLSRAARVIALHLALWWGPLVAAGVLLGWQHTIVREGIFFSKAAMITFGGAYAVLPYIAQQAVENQGWLSQSQMMDGLGLAETTPGPLIMVVQFVGFMGAWNHPQGLSPLTAATLGALMITWVTFVPCFLWIFLGAPHVEQMRGNATLTAALSGVTAAVVGVILNLAVWFGVHALFPAGRLDGFVLVVSMVALVGLHRWKWDVVGVVLGCGLLGLIYSCL